MSNKVFVRLTNGECEKRDLPGQASTDVIITSSVGAGGHNKPTDVVTIQKALNRVAPGSGGPPKPLDVDGKVGPLTNGAIAKFQTHFFHWADSRIDPENITIATLRACQPGAGSKVPNPRSPATIPLVYLTIPNARQLITGAKRYLTSSREHLLGTATNKTQAADRYAKLNVFFSLDKLPPALSLANVERINKVFLKMEKALAGGGRLGSGHSIFQPDPLDQKDVYAYTYAGGFTRRGPNGSPKMSKDDNYEGPNLREDSIYICSGLEGRNGDFTAYNTVHELAHWVGPEINHPDSIHDFSYRHKADFYSLPASTALRTADSYAMFAVAASDRGLAEDAMIFMPPMIIRGSSGGG